MFRLPSFYSILLPVLCFLVTTWASPINTTALLPDIPHDFSNHGDSNLLCRPAKWTDVVVFYLGNYIAHAATIRSLPGQSPLGGVITIIAALLFPTSGVLRGFDAISSRAFAAKTDLQTAARAGALCMIKRIDPNDREKVRKQSIALISTKIHGRCPLPDGYTLTVVPKDAEFEDDEPRHDGIWFQRRRHQLLAGFKPPEDRTTVVASNYNIVKGAVSLGQSLYAIATLYQTRGDQITRYGYAAFGLTVTPYAYMSVVNLLGNCMCPEYPAMYLVESQSMRDLKEGLEESQSTAEADQKTPQDHIPEPQPDLPPIKGRSRETEAKKPTTETRQEEQQWDVAPGSKPKTPIHGYDFQGVVGKLKPSYENSLRKSKTLKLSEAKRDQHETNGSKSIFISAFLLLEFILISLGVIAALIAPVIIIGGLSKFHEGSSTHAQRAWTMTWLAFGIFSGIGMVPFLNLIEDRKYLNHDTTRAAVPMRLTPGKQIRSRLSDIFIILAIYGAPAIGGFVVVGQMILNYGICTQIY